MKAVVYAVVALLLVVGGALALSMEDSILNDDLIEAINADSDSTWVAGRNERYLLMLHHIAYNELKMHSYMYEIRLEGMSVDEFSRLLGVKSNERLPTKGSSPVSDAIPDSFDARQNWYY